MFLSFVTFVMQRRINYCLAAFLLASLPFLFWLAASFVVLVTLRRGAFEGAVVMLASLLPSVLLVGFGDGGMSDWSQTGELALSGVSILQNLVLRNDVVSLVLLFFVAILLRETVKLSWALVAAAISVCLCIVFEIVPVASWVLFFEANFDQFVVGLPPEYRTELSALSVPQKQELLRYISGHYLGLILMLQLYFPLLMGRWMQSKLYNPQGFSIEFTALSYNAVTATLLMLSGLFLDKVLPNAAGVSWVLIAPLVVVGAAIVHMIVQSRESAGRGWLVGFYLLLPVTFNFVAVLGWLDTMWNVRSKLNGRTD